MFRKVFAKHDQFNRWSAAASEGLAVCPQKNVFKFQTKIKFSQSSPFWALKWDPTGLSPRRHYLLFGAHRQLRQPFCQQHVSPSRAPFPDTAVRPSPAYHSQIISVYHHIRGFKEDAGCLFRSRWTGTWGGLPRALVLCTISSSPSTYFFKNYCQPLAFIAFSQFM